MGIYESKFHTTTFTDLVISGKLAGDAELLKNFTDDITKYCADHPEEGSEIIYAMLQELQSLRDQNSKVKVESYTDGLTGLHNRRFYQRMLSEIDHSFATGKRVPTGRHFLALIDLDDFKAINDIHGHLAGDTALQHISKTMQDLVRKTDIVCRIGGDEFAIILKDATEEGIRNKISEISDALSGMNFEFKGQTILLNASIGYAEINPSSVRSMERIISEADANLYNNKKNRKPRLEPQDIHPQPRPNLGP